MLMFMRFATASAAFVHSPQALVGAAARRVRPRHGVVRMASLKTGIVGLPNVGKSTLFNALTGTASAQAANFPFCTIDPNVGMVYVQDERIDKLVILNESVKAVKASLEFVDIAGLVAGASKGEGLGNKFLANIRETDVIVHVVRCFVDENVIHVASTVDPVRDIEVIALELMLADLEQVEKRLARVKKERSPVTDEVTALEKLKAALDDGVNAREVALEEAEAEAVKGLRLLTAKKVIYAANVADEDLADGNAMSKEVVAFAEKEGAQTVIVSAQVEAELSELDEADTDEFLESLGVEPKSRGLPVLVRAAYDTLGLRTYFTSGPTETRAWTIRKGMLAPQAAGVIHDDFERGFIASETIAYDELVEAGSEKAAKEAGKMRSEGKTYEVQDGDVCLFRFNV